MSDPGLGPPISPLDSVCKQYKDCQKCARSRFGNSCIGEFTRYAYDERSGDKFCKDTPDSCKRALCECDLQFAKDHVSVAHHFSTDYHLFWSTTGWNPEENCPGTPGGPVDIQCCGRSDGPYSLFNALNKKCCGGNIQAGAGSC